MKLKKSISDSIQMLKMNKIISVHVFEYWETHSLAEPSVVRAEVYYFYIVK